MHQLDNFEHDIYTTFLEEKEITGNDIIDKICEIFDVKLHDFKKHSRKWKYLYPRWIFCYIEVHFFNKDYREVLENIGYTDNLIFNITKNLHNLLDTDKKFVEKTLPIWKMRYFRKKQFPLGFPERVINILKSTY